MVFGLLSSLLYGTEDELRVGSQGLPRTITDLDEPSVDVPGDPLHQTFLVGGHPRPLPLLSLSFINTHVEYVYRTGVR